MNNLHIIHHTHWDREWYESYATFQIKLKKGILYILDLLDRKVIKFFHLDGQTIVIDDLRLVLNQVDYDRLITYIKSGVIEIGPWYVLSDGFLSDGESYFKNLELGIKIANSLNQDPRIGYFPDTFGHVSQIPQILKLNKIDTALIHRGSTTRHYLNQWSGSDGSIVNAFVLQTREGYYQDFFHNDNNYEDQINKYLSHLANSDLKDFFILDGCDHTFISKSYQDKIKFLEDTKSYNINEIRLIDYLNNLDFTSSNMINGEQVNPNKAFVLQGTFSTRLYLKQMYYRNVNLLSNVLEPILVILKKYEVNQETLDYIWKQQLSNIGHDSICGCSIDTVHQEMENRLKNVYDSIYSVLNQEMYSSLPYSINSLGKNKMYLYIYNPKVDTMILNHAKISIPGNNLNNNITLYRNGNKIDLDILDKVIKEELYAQVDQAPQYQDVIHYQVSFYDEACTVGFYKYEVRFDNELNLIDSNLISKLENNYYEIFVKNNRLYLKSKNNEQEYDDLLKLLHSYDAGDSYNYSKPDFDIETYATITDFTYHCTKHTQELKLTYQISVPKGLLDTRTGLVDEVSKMDIDVLITMDSTSALKVKVNYDNTCEDCKIRIGFNTNSNYISSNTAFDLVRRDLIPKVYPKATNGIESPWYTYLSLHSLYHDQNNIQICHNGCVELELENNYAYLTMTRAIGWLSRRDLHSRDGGAGPSIECHDAQCLREHDYMFILNYDQSRYDANLYKRLYPLYTWLSEVDISFKSLYHIDNQSIGISQIKPDKIRYYNETDVKQTFNYNGALNDIDRKKIIERDRM